MSHEFIAQVSKNESLANEVREAIRSVIDEPRSRGDLGRLEQEFSANPELARELERAVAEVAEAHAMEFDGARDDRELTDAELELVSGGPTAVEYAVMLALIIVVCIAAVAPLPTGQLKSR